MPVLDASKPETKEDRRARILQRARDLMGAGGFDGLSLRKLAAAADVTVPTIYNLVGGKEQILFELVGDFIGLIEAALSKIDEDRPLEKAEAIVIVATDEIANDPDYHRASHLADEHLGRSDRYNKMEARLGRRAATMQENAARSAQKLGLLEGNISAALIGKQIFRNYHAASTAWAHRQIGLEEFRRIAMLGVYMNLAADAAPDFKKTLVKKIKHLDTD